MDHGQQDAVPVASQLMKFCKGVGQAIGGYRLRHSGNHKQVTAFGHFLEVR
jgi:hypothetical protein